MRGWVLAIAVAWLGLAPMAWADGPDIRSGWTVLSEAELPKSATKQVKRGIKMLEKEQYSAFLVAFVHAGDVPDMDPGSPEFAERFAGDKAETVLSVLRLVGEVPVFEVRDPDGGVAYAVVVHDRVEDAPRDLVLQDLDGSWKIRN